MKIISARPRMGVDDAEGLFLGAQMDEHAGEHRVLQHIGEISGVEAVTVIHGRLFERSAMGRRRGARNAARLTEAA